MADDVWAGIPVELREKWQAWYYADVYFRLESQSPDGCDEFDALVKRDAAEAAFTDALRSLLSRLQEAENQVRLLSYVVNEIRNSVADARREMKELHDNG